MPYKSEAQRKYFNANRDKLEAEGVDVDEWNESSKGKKLPEKAEKKAMSDLNKRMLIGGGIGGVPGAGESVLCSLSGD